MKKLLFLVFIISMFLVGCGNEIIEKETEVITLRPYTETVEKGVFATKEEKYDLIEYTFEYNGEIILHQEYSENLLIGDKTMAIVYEMGDGYVGYDLQLSLDDYKKMYGLDN